MASLDFFTRTAPLVLAGILAASASTATAAPAATPNITGFWVQQAGTPAPAMALTPWARTGQDAAAKAVADRKDACAPRSLYGLDAGSGTPIEILRGEGEFVVLSPDNRTFPRHIYTDGREHPSGDDEMTTNNGHSIGRWQGQALVTESVSFDVDTPIGNPPAPHGEALKATERFSLADQGATLVHELTLQDAKAFVRPYTVVSRWKRDPAGAAVQQVCMPVAPKK